MKKFEIKHLTENFYNVYTSDKYPELLEKDNRPFLILLIEIGGNKFAIPFRTNIKHNYCYKFKSSGRDTKSITGLDFTKAIVIDNEKYLGDATTIDNKEYVELENKIEFIIKKFATYVEGYKKYKSGIEDVNLERKYKYTTLKYFI